MALKLTILVLDQAVEEYTCHGDGITREVWVVVHALTDLETSRRVPVTGEEGEDVILTDGMTSCGHHFFPCRKKFNVPQHRDEP